MDDESQKELERLRAWLHARCLHPDFDYATTDGPRKAFDGHPPAGEGWERNVEQGDQGWERFTYHEEAYWRRRKAPVITLAAVLRGSAPTG